MAVITGTDGTLSGDIVIPDTLGGYPVGTISDDAFAGCKNITNIAIPDSIWEISLDAFKGCINLAEITVASGNSSYCIENGALCSESFVVCLPPKSGVKEYDIGNKSIGDYAFAGCEDLEYIYMGENGDIYDGYWVGTTPSLKAYVVDEANENWSSDENGALYTKDKTMLISYPPKTTATEIIVPDSVEMIFAMAFSGEYDAVLHISDLFSDLLENGVDISEVLSFIDYSSFEGFAVSNNNNYFAVEDGVLYSADKTTLLKYPIKNERSFFKMPESVTSIRQGAFISLDYSSTSLKDINDTDDYNGFFLRPDHLTVHASCEMFLSSDDIENHTSGLIGIKELCLNIREKYDSDEFTEESEKAYIDGVNLLCLSSLDKITLEVPQESLEAVLFEAVICAGHTETEEPEEPEIPDGPQILYIEFETYPSKTGYVLGEDVNVDGTVLRVVYDNGDVEYVTQGYTYSPLMFNKVGVNYVTISYQGFETGFEEYVELGPPKSITVNTMPDKTEYYIEESFDPFGLSITAEYGDGSTETVIDGFTVYCDELNEVGTYEVTVEYEGCHTSFNVEVVHIDISCIYVYTYPDKLQYDLGESLDTTGLEIVIVYDLEYPDFYNRIISEGFDVDCDLSTPGTKTAVVSYTEDGVTHTTEFAVEVKETVLPADITMPDVSASSGQTVSIPVNISGNSGFTGFSLVLEYDTAVLAPVSVTAGDMLGSGSLSDSIGGTISDKLKVTYYSDETVSADGTLFYVNFAVAENVVGDYTVNVSYIQKDTFDENFENVIFDCGSSTVSISMPDDGKVRFYSSSVTADAGRELVVPVYASNTRGLTDFTLTLTFNEEILDFKEVRSDIISEADYDGNGTVTLICSNASINTDELLILNAVFDVEEYIEAEETVQIICDSVAVNGTTAEAVCTNAYISIVNPYADEPAFVYTDKRASITEGYVDIPVYINNNHGMMGFGMNISYNAAVLEPVSVTKGDIISSGSFNDSIGVKQGRFKVVWSNSEDVTDNGLLFTVRFRVLDEQNMKRVPVEFSYSQPDTFNEKWEDVLLDIRIYRINTADDLPEVVMIARRTLEVGDTTRLLPSYNFEATGKVWTSSNPDVAIVDGHGNVTAVGEGKCYITVKCYGRDSSGNEIQASCKTKIIVNEKSGAKTLKEFFRDAFEGFFTVRLYDLTENLKKFLVTLFRIAY